MTPLAEATLDTPEALQDYFDKATQGLILVDRKARIKQINQAVEAIIGKSSAEIAGVTIGQGLACIHIGDHPDGCGHGSICGNCFLLNAVKQGFRTKKAVSDTGRLPIGGGNNGVVRPQLKVDVYPLMYQERWHAVVSLVDVTQNGK